MNYRKCSLACFAAWVIYKKANPGASVVAFVAGWNAARAS